MSPMLNLWRMYLISRQQSLGSGPKKLFQHCHGPNETFGLIDCPYSVSALFLRCSLPHRNIKSLLHLLFKAQLYWDFDNQDSKSNSEYLHIVFEALEVKHSTLFFSAHRTSCCLQLIINTFYSIEYNLRSNHLFLQTNEGLILTLAARDDLILAELVADQGFKPSLQLVCCGRKPLKQLTTNQKQH